MSTNLVGAIRRNSEIFSGDPAIVSGDLNLSWSELCIRISKLAGSLSALGVKKGDRLATLVANSYQAIEFSYAVFWLGAVIVPVNTRWSEQEIRYALEDCGATYLLLDGENISSNFNYGGVRIIYTGEKHDNAKFYLYNTLVESGIEVDSVDLSGQDLASIYYTGGTTGRSKGVMLSHANHFIHSLALVADAGLVNDGPYLHAAPMFHIADGLFTHAFTLIGGTHCILEKFSPQYFAAAVREYAARTTILVPTMIQMLLTDEPSADIALNTLKRMFYGASPMPESVIQKILQRYSALDMYQVYGQSESSPVLTILKPEHHSDQFHDLSVRRSAGRAMIGTQVEIHDVKGRRCEPNQVGEIVARGDQVMLGYLGLDEETAKVLKDGWLHTGDSGFKNAEGFVFVVDRIKDMIITGGENVYSIEVEQAIYGVTGVHQCCVVGLPDEQWGERVHAVIVPRDGFNLSLDDITSFCKSVLGSYKVPRSITFQNEPLPLSGAGKILKREVREALINKMTKS